MIILILGLVVLVVILWAIMRYNGIIRLKILVDEALSGIDVQHKKRSDLIPNLVAIVKQYGIHEKEVLENVVKMRVQALSSTGLDQKLEAEAEVTGALKTLFAVVENYPELKANENFLALQHDLSGVEHELSLSRRYYNGTVRNYNMSIGLFPANMIARHFNFTPIAYFELIADTERQAPKINF